MREEAEVSVGRGGGKPLGVMLLALLYIAVGAVSFLFLAKQGAGAIGGTGAVRALFLLMLVIYPSLGLAAGVGMWLGRRWGWWLGVFGVVSAALRNLWVIAGLPSLMTGMGVGGRGATILYARFGFRVVLAGLIAVYLFRADVLEYFRMPRVSRGKALAVVAALSVLLIAAGELSGNLR